MDKFLIKGGKALRGTVAISGAKNSALPVMAAALLTEDKVVIRNVPKVRDLVTMSKLLAFMDAKVSATAVPANEYEIQAPKLNHADALPISNPPAAPRSRFAAGRMRDRGAAGGF